MRLKNKVAIITGAASGIGQATALLFCREGAAVVVADVADGRETMRLLREQNRGEAIFSKTDVSKSSEIEKMVQETLKTFRKIDILFNNAGINPEAARTPLAESSEEHWDKVMDINLKGIFLASKYVIPHMIEKGGGSIVNTASIYSSLGYKNRCIYGTSKGGVAAITKSMAIDYAPHNIRVNCICPSTVETAISKKTLNKARQDERLWKEYITDKIPLGRPGRPEDIAYAVLFLASDESAFITGTSLMVDGGYSAQ